MNTMSLARIVRLMGSMLLAVTATSIAIGAEILVTDKGEGGDYVSGAPITLPAATLSTNLFGEGVKPIKNRLHRVQPAAFDAAGALNPVESANPCPFPEYLKNNHYVWFLQEVRRYTNYSCTITVDCPVTFYLLVDNRVNDFTAFSSLDDPTFGPPDTEWIPRDGWTRVNTGISPRVGGASRPDYLRIYEGGVGSVSQFYAIYSRTLSKGGSVTLRTQFEGNMYCVVIATNGTPASAKGHPPKLTQHPAGG